MTAVAIHRPAVGAAAIPGAVVAIVCFAAVSACLSLYPLSARFLAAALLAYAVILWIRPGAWLIVVPAVLAGLDLMPFTGWVLVGEADLFVLVTIGLLAVRVPLSLNDLLPHGPARYVVALSVATLAIGVGRGLWAAPGLPDGSDITYLRPENALRVAKGLATALVLLPFLRNRQRIHGDAVSLFTVGMLAGSALVVAQILVERIRFLGITQILTFYPASGPFTSMHVGGDHLGAYLAMALPFAILWPASPRLFDRVARRVFVLVVVYALVISFSVVSSSAAVLGVAVVFLGWVAFGSAGRLESPGLRLGKVIRGTYLALWAGLILFGLAGASLMQLGTGVAESFVEDHERTMGVGLELMDYDISSLLFGTGMGSYPRVRAMAGSETSSNFVIRSEPEGTYLRLANASTFYLGQKISFVVGPSYTVSLALRSAEGKGAVLALLCEKQLQLSDHCQGQTFKALPSGEWSTVTAVIPTSEMTGTGQHAFWPRPIEFSLVDPIKGTSVDLKSVSLIGPDHRELIANENFVRGTDRWYFTDDDYKPWQMTNQLGMALFEGGLVGFLGFLMLPAAALLGAERVMRQGDRTGTAITASLAVMLFVCFFDTPLQSTRVSAIFYLICCIGLVMLEQGTSRAYLRQVRSRPDEHEAAGA